MPLRSLLQLPPRASEPSALRLRQKDSRAGPELEQKGLPRAHAAVRGSLR